MTKKIEMNIILSLFSLAEQRRLAESSTHRELFQSRMTSITRHSMIAGVLFCVSLSLKREKFSKCIIAEILSPSSYVRQTKKERERGILPIEQLKSFPLLLLADIRIAHHGKHRDWLIRLECAHPSRCVSWSFSLSLCTSRIKSIWSEDVLRCHEISDFLLEKKEESPRMFW